MPIYIYACPQCDVLIEERRPMDLADFPPVECPVCHGLCERQMAMVHINRGALPPEAPADAPPDHPPGCPCCGGRRAS